MDVETWHERIGAINRELLDSLNDRFCAVTVGRGPRFVVYTKHREGYWIRCTKGAVKSLYEHMQAMAWDGYQFRIMRVGEWWLAHPGKAKAAGTISDPDQPLGIVNGDAERAQTAPHPVLIARISQRGWNGLGTGCVFVARSV